MKFIFFYSKDQETFNEMTEDDIIQLSYFIKLDLSVLNKIKQDLENLFRV